MRGPDPEILRRWIAAALEKPDRSKRGLAAAINRAPSAVSQILNGERKISAQELPLIAAYLGEPIPPEAMPTARQTVKLVGYVGAGAEANYFSDGHSPNESVDAPEGSTPDTVAVEIRGSSLGDLFDRWLVFYDERREPVTADLLNRLCVVGLEDGRVLVKKLKRGRIPGAYDLLSNTEPPIYDAAISWAARVKQMTPR